MQVGVVGVGCEFFQGGGETQIRRGEFVGAEGERIGVAKGKIFDDAIDGHGALAGRTRMAGDQPVGFAHEPFDVAVETFELADLVGGVGEGSRQAHALRAVGGIDEPFARRGNFGGGAGA
ncbi:MAG: hypothetical protein ACREJ2_11945, partial [Planctomycetota bacterium]